MDVAWLRWWSGEFVAQIHPDWQTLAYFQLPAAVRDRLLLQDPPALLPLLDIDSITPESAPAWLGDWLTLSPAARDLALRLAQTVITPQQAPILPTAQLKIWCQRLHRALCPALWAGAAPHSGALLLRRSLAPGCWQRVRLLLAAGVVHQAQASSAAALPQDKSTLLWQAVIWQARRGDINHVDNQTAAAG